ncbi:SH3 domain-containing protein [Planktotalea sp.]|uniref:SH3 domain-containing protein n=1 Tax=Planktotalea sp. TaxID=2029877 RepID=UPI003F6D9407
MEKNNVKKNIIWFIENFGDRVAKRVEQTPLTLSFVASIAVHETGYIWSNIRKSVSTEEEFLELCVGDKLGWDAGRSYFPAKKKTLLDAPNGPKMYKIARDVLKKAAAVNPKTFGSYFHDSDNILFGYGIFQYDLLFYNEGDSQYFLEKGWMDFDRCLEKAIEEMLLAAEFLGYDRDSNEKISNYDLALIGAIYNGGSKDYDPLRGLKQIRWIKWAQKYYGELIYQYMNIADAVIGGQNGNKRYLVNARSGLRLRAGPSVKFDVLKLVPFGTSLALLGYGGSGNAWAQVDLENDGVADGFVFSEFLREA